MTAVPEPLRGNLLVSSPRLGDPNFDRTVVLVLDHGDEGALGVVINRPTHAVVSDILEAWMDLAARTPPANVFSGGPVSLNAVIGLARASPAAPTDTPASLDSLEPGGPQAWRPVLGTVGTVDLSVGPGHQPLDLDGIRLFAGYAGWAAGQLETEMEAGAWFVVDATPDDVFTGDPDGLWHDVLRRQGNDLALLAGFPPHPSVN